MAEWNPKANEVFLKALELADPAAQAALLERECADDAALRAAVETLLKAHAQAGLLDRPIAPEATGAYTPSDAPVLPAATVPHQPTTGAGAVVAGKYKLLQPIGEGGMGSVWMADQTEPVKRRVAVKLIRADRGASDAILARFAAERQAIALMDHPHIARLLDAGATDQGAPFFVMELVKGVPLTDYCDQHRLSVPQRLQLFSQVCGAVQHAHQKGIIHRDLKPSNILVESHDGKPVPKVIDFGLAKAASGMQLTEQTLFTGFGTVAGTPLYMAPEQANFNAVDVDTRADIYALGVILYELLTGATPLSRETMKKAAADELLRLIREEEPPTPSSKLSASEAKPTVAANRQTEPLKLSRFVKGDLDWIVMKALAKERDRRYETASGFAKDLERFLNHEPTQAGPPTARYRLRKFVQRNRGKVIAASLVFLALLAGMAGTTWGLVEAKAAKDRESKRADGERQAKEEAEAQKKKAIAFRDQALDALRATTGLDVEKLIGAKKELTANEKAYLEAIAQRWQAFARQEGTDEQSRAIQAEGHYRVAFLWHKLGRREEARPEYERSILLREKLAADFPAIPAHRKELALSRHNLGFLLHDLGQSAAAEEQYRKALAIQVKLAAEFPAEPEHRQELALSHSNLGSQLMDLGKLKEAEEQYRQAFAIRERLAADFPAVPGFRDQLAASHISLGNLLRELGKLSESEAQCRRALAIEERLAVENPAIPEYRRQLAAAHLNLGVLLLDLGKQTEAEEQYRKALALFEKLAAEFPAVSYHRRELAVVHHNLGGVLLDLGKQTEAEEHYRQALALREKVVAESPAVPDYRQDLARSHNDLGLLLARLGKRTEAEGQHRRALAIREKLASDFPAVPEHRKLLANSHHSLHGMLKGLGRITEAEEQCRKALAIREDLAAEFPAVPEHRQDVANSLTNLGNLLMESGRQPEAEKVYRKGLSLLDKLAAEFPAVPDYRQDLAACRYNLGALLARAGKRAEAEEQYRNGLTLLEKLAAVFPDIAEYRQELARSLNNLGLLLAAMGERAEAEEQHRKALAIQEKLSDQFPAVPAYRVELGGSYCNFGILVRDGGKPADSLEWFLKAIAVLQPIHEAEPRDVTAKQFLRNSHMCRAVAYDRLGKHAEAVKDWDRTVALSPTEEEAGYRVSRAKSRVRAGQVPEAMAEVAELSKIPDLPPPILYDLACLYAVASSKLAGKQDDYAKSAMELLQQAVKAGYKDAVQLKTDTDLDPLRGREDFKKLLAELERPPEPKKQPPFTPPDGAD